MLAVWTAHSSIVLHELLRMTSYDNFVWVKGKEEESRDGRKTRHLTAVSRFKFQSWLTSFKTGFFLQFSAHSTICRKFVKQSK